MAMLHLEGSYFFFVCLSQIHFKQEISFLIYLSDIQSTIFSKECTSTLHNKPLNISGVVEEGKGTGRRNRSFKYSFISYEQFSRETFLCNLNMFTLDPEHMQPSTQHKLRVDSLSSGAPNFLLSKTTSQSTLHPTHDEEQHVMLTLGNPVSPFHPSRVGRGFTIHGHFLPEALVNIDCTEKGD